MKQFAAIEWHRARRTLTSAEQLISSDSDSAASRAYYAAFHAVTALFASRGQTFTRHAGLRAAIHRDLVRTGQWPPELGKAFDFLMDLREVGDYGGLTQVSQEDARMATAKAGKIIEAVLASCPELESEMTL